MPSSTLSSPLPTLYRSLFLYIDPLFFLFGFYLHILPSNHPQTLSGYSPSASTITIQSTPTTTTVPLLLENLAGFFLTLGVLEGILLRVKATDIAVWRTVEGCIFLLDVVMVYTHAKALTVEGRWDVGAWRGDDYRNIVGNATMGLARLCCALGIGMLGETTKVKAK